MASMLYIPVYGTFTYRDLNQTPVRNGEISFNSVTGSVARGGTITIPKPFVCRLDSMGKVPNGFMLPCFINAPIVYEVKELFSGGRASYLITVTPDMEEIDLANYAGAIL